MNEDLLAARGLLYGGLFGAVLWVMILGIAWGIWRLAR